LLNRVEQFKVLSPPDDSDIRTLYIGGITPNITESDLRDHFYAFGEIKSIKLVNKATCAFITYNKREEAEAAAEALFNKLIVKGTHLRISWGKPQQLEPGEFQGEFFSGDSSPNYFSLPPPGTTSNPYYLQQRPYYPSMDPNLMGSRPIDSDPLQNKEQQPHYPTTQPFSVPPTSAPLNAAPFPILVPNPTP